MENEREAGIQELCDKLYKPLSDVVTKWAVDSSGSEYTQGQVLDAFCLALAVVVSAMAEVNEGGAALKESLVERMSNQIGKIAKGLDEHDNTKH